MYAAAIKNFENKGFQPKKKKLGNTTLNTILKNDFTVFPSKTITFNILM
jgi:hypothetical protein